MNLNYLQYRKNRVCLFFTKHERRYESSEFNQQHPHLRKHPPVNVWRSMNILSRPEQTSCCLSETRWIKPGFFPPPNLEVYRAGWLDKSGLHSLLDCNTRVTPYTELNTLHWRWVRVLSPPPEKAQHPSSWAHTLRDPHHKPRADALPSRWSSSSGSSVGAVHGFPLSPPPTFFTFFFNGVTFYVEYFSISSR